MAQGGYRPTAPQNNTGVSAVGGAGSKDGQPNRYISGGTYGEGKALMQQQQSAAMAQAPAPTGGGSNPAPKMPELQTLTDNIGGKYSDITDGGDFGSPIGSAAMPKNISADTRAAENDMMTRRYLPDLVHAASFPDAPDSFKRFVNYLASK